MRQIWVHEFIEELLLGISVRKQESGVGKEERHCMVYQWVTTGDNAHGNLQKLIIVPPRGKKAGLLIYYSLKLNIYGILERNRQTKQPPLVYKAKNAKSWQILMCDNWCQLQPRSRVMIEHWQSLLQSFVCLTDHLKHHRLLSRL